MPQGLCCLGPVAGQSSGDFMVLAPQKVGVAKLLAPAWSGRRKMCMWEEPVTPSRAPVGSTSLGSITCQHQRLETKPLKGFKVQEVMAPTAFPAASLCLPSGCH